MKIIKVLSGIYTFTRNNYTPAFFKKGKTRPIQLMQKNIKNLLMCLGTLEILLWTDTLDVLEELACHVKQNDVHEFINSFATEVPII